MTSTEAVTYVKRLFNAQKVGHGGTLDLLADGVLPIALGEATKLMGYSLDAVKAYRFTVQFGSQTNTDDAEGEVVKVSKNRPTHKQLDEILHAFVGKIEQIPPAFSAIKINGKPAYVRARSGEDVKMKSREVEVFDLKCVDFSVETAVLEAIVSKGTYVRSLARDIGEKLGCYGYVISLKRVKAACFELENSISKETLDKMVEKGESPRTCLLDIGIVLNGILEYVASPQEVWQLKHGMQMQRIHLKAGLRKVVTQKGKLISMVEIDEKGTLKIKRNFNC